LPVLDHVHMPIRLPNERDLPFFAANVSDTQGQLVIELRKQRTNENPFLANGVFVTVGVSERFNNPIALSPHESCSFPISLQDRKPRQYFVLPALGVRVRWYWAALNCLSQLLQVVVG